MISPREWIDRLREHARSACAGSDSEGVHQLRVAAGRLSVWLELGGKRVLRDDLAWMRRSAGPLRDLDVIMELLAATEPEGSNGSGAHPRSAEHEPSAARVGSAPTDPRAHARTRETDGSWASSASSPARTARSLGARCLAERADALRTLAATLSSDRFRALLQSLAWLPPLDESAAREALTHFHARVRRAEKRLSRDRDDLRALHRLRRAVRRLRYALEWLGDDAQRWKRVQDDLGELNNFALLLHRLEDPKPALAAPENGSASRSHFRRDIHLEIDRRRARFADDWSRELETPEQL
jgi:CHAD domain-containing protein